MLLSCRNLWFILLHVSLNVFASKPMLVHPLSLVQKCSYFNPDNEVSLQPTYFQRERERPPRKPREEASIVKPSKNPLEVMEKNTETAGTGTVHASSSSSSAENLNNESKASSQFNEDANLLAEFEQSRKTGNAFNYSRLVKTAKEPVPEEQIVAYLSKLQRGGHIQSFGCLFAVEEPSFRILAHSENSVEMLGLDMLLDSKPCIELLGIDVRTLFSDSSGESLTKAIDSNDISLFNPVSVNSKRTQKPFYAILHRIDVGIVIDLEPVISGDKSFSIAGAMQSQKLAVQAISRLQSLPGGDVSLLCDTLVEDIQQLTGYDRVMVYKFYEDEHGEVVSEIRRSDLEPYLGLHYPATDLPQVTRFLFKQNRVRMICDSHASPACIVQVHELRQPLCLINSTLRSPHRCHTQYMANMGSVASLVMAIIVKGNGSLKLWGLVACHHCSPRYVSFSLRYACEFLMQAFAIQLNMELQLLEKLEEAKTLRTQTMLCDMLLRDVPLGLVSQSPNIMDLVKCDGAAMFYGGKCRLLGITPTELQIKDIADWLITYDSETTGLSTDSLVDAGYPGAALLEDMVCGMATVKITSNDFLFWFRSHTAKEVKWGGAKHNPEDKDDDGKMHPRSSFKAFLEVVKNRSLPWDVLEMNAIHSLQLIMRGHSSATIMDNATTGSSSTLQVDELRSVACEMVRFLETASTPVFAVDLDGNINGWNAKMAELTGLLPSDAMGKSLVNELVHEESQAMFENHLSRAMRGVEDKNIELKLRKFGKEQQNQVLVIVANACASRDCANSVSGVCFMGQDVTEEKAVMDKFIRLQVDYKAIIQSLNPLIPPIFASDENACCCEWNTAMEKLTGLTRGEVIGKMLAGEIFGGLCRMKHQDAITKFMILLYQAICNQVTEKFAFTFADRKGKFMEFLVTANKRTDMGGSVIGCFCFLHNITPELQQVLELQTQPERRCFARLKELAYIRQEMKNPLRAIWLCHKKILESTSVSDEMKQFLETSDACEKQMMNILEDSGIETIEEGSMELKMSWFSLGSAIDAVVSQVMILLRANKLQLIQEIPEQARALFVYGDQVRLQQVLSDFLLHIVQHASYPDGWVELIVTTSLKSNQDGTEFVQLQFRMTHPGQGLPSELIQDMVGGGTQWVSPEGIGLTLSCKVLKLMNGQVHYIRDSSKCFFLIDIEFQAATKMFTDSEVDVN